MGIMSFCVVRTNVYNLTALCNTYVYIFYKFGIVLTYLRITAGSETRSEDFTWLQKEFDLLRET